MILDRQLQGRLVGPFSSLVTCVSSCGKILHQHHCCILVEHTVGFKNNPPSTCLVHTTAYIRVIHGTCPPMYQPQLHMYISQCVTVQLQRRRCTLVAHTLSFKNNPPSPCLKCTTACTRVIQVVHHCFGTYNIYFNL